MLKNLAILFPLIAALPLGACTNQMYVMHRTVVGVDGAVNTAKTSGHVVVGYNRVFTALVPKSVPKTDKPEEKEAMSAVNCSRLEVEGIFLTKFVDFLVTGEAATKFAEQLKQGHNFKCDQVQ